MALKRYSIFYPRMMNIDIIKETGAMAHFLCQTGNYAVTLVSLQNEEYTNMELIDSRVANAYIHRRTGSMLLDSLLYLLAHGKQIDVLQLIHLSKASVILAFFYKMLNPRGMVYIKLDTSERELGHLLLSNSLKGKLRDWILHNTIDLVSSETKSVYSQVKANWGSLADKLIYLPNGINAERDNPAAKQRIIVTVGRIGTEQKATEVLLAALTRCRLEGWEVKIIGPVESGFQPYIESWFAEHPTMKDRVTFIGPIWDRQELLEHYKKAAIFCLPSRWESFGFVSVEAASRGCYLILTPVGAAQDILETTDYGQLVDVDDTAALAQAINAAAATWTYDQQRIDAVCDAANTTFSWPRIINLLDSRISQFFTRKGHLNECNY